MPGFDTTPRPGFLRAMMNQSWNAHGAVSELVDNGFGPGRGNAAEVEVILDQVAIGGRTLSVIDNGRGMEAIGRLFQLGNTIGRTPGDIGAYGSGGTMALLWLASKVEVWTLRDDGMVSHDSVEWAKELKADRFPVISDDWRRSTKANTPEELRARRHGTMIRLNIAHERSLKPEILRRELARTYAPGIRQGKQLTWTLRRRDLRGVGTDRTTTEQLADPFTGQLTDVVPIDLTIHAHGHDLPVTGAVGLVENLPPSQNTIAVGYGARTIIATRDCFRDPENNDPPLSSAGVTGWLDLGEGWQSLLATTKNAVHDRPVWDALMGAVYQRIRPLLQHAADQALQQQFQDLALGLQRMLDGRATVQVASEGDDEPSPGRGDPAEGAEHPRRPRPERSAQHPSTTILLEPTTDDDLGGLLAKASGSERLVRVLINKEHPLIAGALPLTADGRREVVMLTVAGALTELLVRDDALLAKAFRPAIRRELADRGDDRAARILRLLVDRADTAAA